LKRSDPEGFGGYKIIYTYGPSFARRGSVLDPHERRRADTLGLNQAIVKLPTLQIENFGQIKQAELAFGDLTVLVGPQASGKSIALQLLKLVLDPGQIQAEMERIGIDWRRDLRRFLNEYLGEGMGSAWRQGETVVRWRGSEVDLTKLAGRKQKKKQETLFFIPAQRVLALRDGWPRPFGDYRAGDPFALREFSEHIRLLVERGNGDAGNALFPMPRRLSAFFRERLRDQIFNGFQLRVDREHAQKRLVLNTDGSPDASLPFMVWSAGQREFVPLLLGLYSILPGAKQARHGDLRWVVLEELEMGLHPKAIETVLLLVFELLKRGYRVCLSTHSPQVLEMAWALQRLRGLGGSAESFRNLFDIRSTGVTRPLSETAMTKDLKVYYFQRDGMVRDISSLDPGAEQEGEGGWGGLTEFSGRAVDEVTNAVAQSKQDKGL
jgi:hypothetical protein